MPRIFISYRREDASAYAGRLFDRLSAKYGKERIFMDIDSIEPGADFGEAIEDTVASCDVFIAVMGKQWLDAKDAEGARRLDNPDDFVRLEVAAALGRKIRVIPLLVGNARMPRSDDLPEPLRSLARRNAFEVSDIGFHENISRLIAVLDRLDQANQPQPDPAVAKPPVPPPVSTLLATGVPAQTSRPAAAPAMAVTQPAPVVVAHQQQPVRYFVPSVNPVSSSRPPSMGKALLFHLLFGFGLAYVNPGTKRKYFYPIVCGYAVFDCIMAVNSVEPYRGDFGAVTFLLSLAISVLGFIDVAVTCRSVKKKFGSR